MYLYILSRIYATDRGAMAIWCHFTADDNHTMGKVLAILYSQEMGAPVGDGTYIFLTDRYCFPRPSLTALIFKDSYCGELRIHF